MKSVVPSRKLPTTSITSSRINDGTESRLETDFIRSTSTDDEDSLRLDGHKNTNPLFVEISPQQAHYPPVRNNGFPNVPGGQQQLSSPKNSQSRISVSKSSVREIFLKSGVSSSVR